MADLNAPQATVPIAEIPINFKDTTVVVEPTAAIDGFDEDSYDSVVITSELEFSNSAERTVEIPLPFPTESFTASMAVISKGPDEYSDRVVQITKVKGDLDRFIPYLRRLQVSEAIIQDKKALKKLLGGYRVGLLNLPAGNVAVRIQVAMIVRPDSSDPTRKTFKFRVYAPLPSFLVGGGAQMELLAIFNGAGRHPKTINDPVVTNPYGDAVGLNPTQRQDLFGRTMFYWTWKNDPVVDFEYRYQ